MICSLDFSSLYTGLAIGSGVALSAWALWAGTQASPGSGKLTAKPAGALAPARSAAAYVNLVQQARLRIESGHDATEILERAIGLVRARRMFIVAVMVTLWVPAMFTAQQFLGGNARCLRMITETEVPQMQKIVAVPADSDTDRHTVKRDPARPGTGIMPVRSLDVSGFRARPAYLAPVLPANRREVLHGPA